MKFLLIVNLAFLLAVNLIKAQSNSWGKAQLTIDYSNPRVFYNDTVNGWFYVAGNVHSVNGKYANRIVCMNSNGYVDFMDTASIFADPPVAIMSYKDSIYFAGFNGLYTYQNNHWDPKLGGNHVFLELETYNDELLIGGLFKGATVPYDGAIISYDGNSFNQFNRIDTLFDVTESSILAMEVYKNKLYIGGNFEGKYNEIFSWDGTNWDNMNGGIQGNSGFEVVNDIIEYKDYLYVVGTFSSDQGAMSNNILKWDGDKWSTLGKGIYGSFISDAYVFNEELWVVGYLDSAENLPLSHLAIWNGDYWCRPEGDLQDHGTCLGEFNDSLYVGGIFNDIDGDTDLRKIAKYNSSSQYLCDSSTVGYAEISLNSSVIMDLYPNPSYGKVFFSFKELQTKVRVELLEINGSILYSWIFLHTKQEEIDFSHYLDGIYIIRFYNGNNVYNVRVVKSY